jgi:hypothetical protein
MPRNVMRSARENLCDYPVLVLKGCVCDFWRPSCRAHGLRRGTRRPHRPGQGSKKTVAMYIRGIFRYVAWHY